LRPPTRNRPSHLQLWVAGARTGGGVASHLELRCLPEAAAGSYETGGRLSSHLISAVPPAIVGGWCENRWLSGEPPESVWTIALTGGAVSAYENRWEVALPPDFGRPTCNCEWLVQERVAAWRAT
jgi:hypothetical protein